MISLFPVKKTEITGKVLNTENDCLVLRDDSNTEYTFCGFYVEAGSIIQITERKSLCFDKLNFKSVKILKETDEFSDIINTMTPEEKLGQLLIVRTDDNLAKPLDFEPAGYILFGNDFSGKNEEDIRNMTSQLQKLTYGALIMVDEEGGKVSRVSKALFEEGYPSSQEIYAQYGWEGVESSLKEKSALLTSLGIQVNLNPVVDVCENPEAFIYERSFGQNAKLTSQYAQISVNLQKASGLISCLKHFPGYGENLDTHTGFSVDTRKLSQFRESDFLPFHSGIDAGAEMVMMSHILMSDVDAEHPASLSQKVHQLLREELNFEGVIITDDLTMDAIELSYDDPQIQAISAGNDLLITTSMEVSIDSMMKAVNENRLSWNKIEESVTRVLRLKKNCKILENVQKNP